MKELAHIPLGRGGGQGERGHRWWWETSPHPSEDREGQASSCVSEFLGANGGGKHEGGGGGMGRGQTNINCDGVDVQFKLRSCSKITFDTGIR